MLLDTADHSCQTTLKEHTPAIFRIKGDQRWSGNDLDANILFSFWKDFIAEAIKMDVYVLCLIGKASLVGQPLSNTITILAAAF